MTGKNTTGSGGSPNGGDDGEPRSEPSSIPSDAELAERLKTLSARLQAQPTANEAVERMRAREKDASGMAKGLRLSSEFIAGIAVGAALGWLVDRVAGTSPFGLIVLLLLGFGAGVLNVMRAAGVVAEPEYRNPGLARPPSSHQPPKRLDDEDNPPSKP